VKNRSFSLSSTCYAALAAFAFLMASCGTSPGASSGSLRAWIDQPINGYTLPLQSLTLKAHASQDGGGVTAIQFMVNDMPLATVPTDAGQELINASTQWNPSAEGRYRIQAIAMNGAGQQALSEVSLICISRDPTGTCGEAPAATPPASAEVDSTIKVGGAPNPASIGANCNPADRIVTFEAYVEDIGDAIEVDIHGYLVGTSGERYEFIVPLSPGTTPGSYLGTLDLGTLYDAVLGGADGRLEYTLSLLGPTKEWSKTSTLQVIQVRYCAGATPIEGIVKVMGTPELVFKGKCTPTTIDFVAETDIDPGMFDRVDLAYVWFDVADTWIGTVGEENRAEMTRDSGGAYRYHLDVNTAPAAIDGGGTIKFRAIVVSTDNADVTFSEVSTIVIKPCGAAVPPPQPQPGITVTPYVPPATCATYNGKPNNCAAAGCYYWSDTTCRDSAEPAAPTCASYNNKPSKCKDLGCYYWSDGSCRDYAEPAPPTCGDFFKNPDGCKNLGCYYWSDNTCNDYAEPAPSCQSYLKPDQCQAAGCKWDEQQTLCY